MQTHLHPSSLVLKRLYHQALQMWQNKMGCSSRFKLLADFKGDINEVSTWT